MSVFEYIISSIAPHACLRCNRTGSLLCAQCQRHLPLDPLQCYICRQLSPAGTTCCTGSNLKTVRASTPYTQTARQLVWQLKFNRARDAARTIAIMCDARFEPLHDVTVTHVPTANARVRLRGYDQARLIAHRYALEAGLPFVTMLARTSNARQVGASARQRRQQLHDGFRVVRPKHVLNTKILLIDDVITTGASLEACAAELVLAGAREVHALTFARA
jgi:ComF family protein